MNNTATPTTADDPKCEFVRLQDGVYDLLVVGGGIVGAGVARDAAMRGLRVALVEQNDFAFGSSGRSTRLLHGGIRYLAQARIGLVREASLEKTVIHRIAPALSQPLAFIFPARKNSDWSRWKLAIGVKIYDWLCGKANLGKSSVLSRAETLKQLPQLAPNELTGAVRYYDGLTNDARLVVDTLRSAASYGAQLNNYVRFVSCEQVGDTWNCKVEQPHAGQQTVVHSKAVVNATGPWSDKIPNSKTSLRLTKGVHLVIDSSRLPLDDAVVVTQGDRILFAIPWGDRVILGTTDTDYQGPIESPECTDEDTHYVLDAANESFPNAMLCDDDIISSWAGLRPLVADSHGNPSDISRRHKVEMSSPGWWDITGGKLTTYRLMAEEVVDSLVGYLKRSAEPCKTATTPLLPAETIDKVSGILPPPVTLDVVAQCCQQEWTLHLEDLMIRRTSWHYYYPDRMAIAASAADWMGQCLDWSEETRERELAQYKERHDNGKLQPTCAATETILPSV